MALEDVVQGVQVNVKTDGVDDAADKIGKLDKAVGDLAKTAEGASGGRGGGSGIGGLSKAFSDLSSTGAEAFANIAKSAAAGDITGLATLLGGRFAGSVAEAAKTITNFAITQDSAVASNAAMAKEFGTTPEIMQGIKDSFAGAGISAGGFERLVNRMSRQVVNDYSSMMANLRTDNDTQEKAALRLQTAQENYQKSLGVPKEVFEAQDQFRAQKQAQIAVDDAVEAQRQTALKSIPHVTELLRQSSRAGKENTDLMEVSVGTLRKSIEYMAGSAPGHIAKGVDVLKQEFDLIKSGAIDADKAYELLSSQMGSRMSAGLSGMDTAQTLQYARTHGAAGITASEAGQSAITQAGLGQTQADAAKATETIAAWSKFTGLLGALMQKVGTTISPAVTGGLDDLSHGLENVPAVLHGAATGMKQAVSGVESFSDKVTAMLPQWTQNFLKWASDRRALIDKNANDQYNEYIKKQRDDMRAKNPPDKLPGTPVPGSGGLTEEYVGGDRLRGAKIIHVPEGYGGPGWQQPAGVETIGTGPGKMIHLSPEQQERVNANAPPGGGVSVLPENPTQAQLDKFNGGAPGGGGISVLPNNPTQADIDKFNGVAPGSGGGGISVLPNNPTQADIDKFNAPVAPPTVHVAAPTVNVAPPNVTIPINVKGAATATAESPAVTPAVATTIPAATGSSGQWQGGAIHVPGFANGGRVRISGDVTPGFADGGSLGIPAAWPQDISSSPWSTQSMLHKIKEELPPNVVTWLAEHVTKVGLEKAGVAGLGDLAGLAFGVVSNPFGVGVVDASPAGASSDRSGGAAQEARARAMGAHNLKEAAELGIPGFAMGSIRGPGNGTSDSILARLSNGEFVMKDAAVRTYGESFMHAINNMQIPPPKYAGGGMIPASSLPHFSEGGAMERPGSILNLHVGGEVFSGLRAPAAVADQLRKFAIGQQTSQTGRKPSWAGG